MVEIHNKEIGISIKIYFVFGWPINKNIVSITKGNNSVLFKNVKFHKKGIEFIYEYLKNGPNMTKAQQELNT